jgi:hypothetical protein
MTVAAYDVPSVELAIFLRFGSSATSRLDRSASSFTAGRMYTPKFAIRLRQADAMRTTFVWIFLYFPSSLEATQSSGERIDVQVFPPGHFVPSLMQAADGGHGRAAR